MLLGLCRRLRYLRKNRKPIHTSATTTTAAPTAMPAFAPVESPSGGRGTLVGVKEASDVGVVEAIDCEVVEGATFHPCRATAFILVAVVTAVVVEFHEESSARNVYVIVCPDERGDAHPPVTRPGWPL